MSELKHTRNCVSNVGLPCNCQVADTLEAEAQAAGFARSMAAEREHMRGIAETYEDMSDDEIQIRGALEEQASRMKDAAAALEGVTVTDEAVMAVCRHIAANEARRRYPGDLAMVLSETDRTWRRMDREARELLAVAAPHLAHPKVRGAITLT
jgi:hypothetical protein